MRGLPEVCTRALCASAAAWLTTTQSAKAIPPKPALRWHAAGGDQQTPYVEVLHLPPATLQNLAQGHWSLPQWQRLFPVGVASVPSTPGEEMPPMTGDYRVVGTTLRFTPPFPLESGLRYRASFRPGVLPDAPADGQPQLSDTFQVKPPARTPTTVVSEIHPSATVLPENLLKFYIHFSAPMRRGHIYDYIRLQDGLGKSVELPFLEIEEELWDPEMKRLTLFLDPGRIKRGVRPLEEVGPSLIAGRHYTLVIDRHWQDAAGNPLRSDFKKPFRIGPPDRVSPDPATWKISAPRRNTRHPLVVQFNEPLDSAILRRVLRVLDARGHPVDGTVALGPEDRRWSLTPDSPWLRGACQLVVPTAIEDLAGNNVDKPFDVDLTDDGLPKLIRTVVKLPFEIR